MVFLWILWVPGHPGDNMIQPTNSGTDGRYTAPSNRWFRLLRAFVGSLVPHFDRQIHIIIYIYMYKQLYKTERHQDLCFCFQFCVCFFVHW